MPKHIAAYIRTSLEGQGHGLDSQERAIAEYLKNHGLEARFYRDEESGGTSDRPAFKRLQRDVFARKVSTIITWKLDRITRKSVREGIDILCDWLERDVRVVAVAQQLDFSGHVGQMIASLLFGLAAMERENVRENTRRGMRAAKERGAVLGRRAKLKAEQFVPLLESGLSLSAAARQLGVSRQGLYKAAQREGVEVSLLINK